MSNGDINEEFDELPIDGVNDWVSCLDQDTTANAVKKIPQSRKLTSPNQSPRKLS